MIKFLGYNIMICIIFSNVIAQNEQHPVREKTLQHKLSGITVQDKGIGTDIKKLEDSCLKLLKEHNSPQDKGKIYSAIAIMYSGKGYSSPNDMRIAKTAEYCSKALKEPLDLITTVEMYSRLAGAQMAYKSSGPKQELIKARQEAILNCLTGLKIVLDSNMLKESEHDAPMMTLYNYDGDPNDPAFQQLTQKAKKRLKQQHAARKIWESSYKISILRKSLISQCSNYYSQEPFNTDELAKYAREILKGHDEAIDEIIAKVQERILKQTNKRSN